MSANSILVILFICCISLLLPANEVSKDFLGSEEYQIGVMVKNVTAAIHDPENPESLETIIIYGTDSRYYVMIRGWLVQELAGIRSQNRAQKNLKNSQKEILLTKAIRRIDLE